MENLFNINQAAYILKVHQLTVRRYIKEGKLKAVRIGGAVRIKDSDLQAFNKDFTPYERKESSSPFRITKTQLAKTFTLDDPILRLKGRGASLILSS
jgi:excisionase family DNA binding protein